MENAFSFPFYRAGIIFVSSTFYGLFFVLFVLSALILHGQCKKNAELQASSTNVYLAFSYMMFTVLTAVWILSALMCFNPNLASGPDLINFNPFMFAQVIVGYLASFIGDAVMVYRLYVILDQGNFILCIAVLLILAGLGLTGGVVAHYIQYRLIQATLNMILVGGSISVNAITSILIARTVWKRSELTMAVGGEKVVRRLIAIIIESSALYTLWMLLFLILHFTNIGVAQIFLYGSPHISGIASMLINVRVGLGWALGEEGRSTRSLHNSAFINDHFSRDSLDI